PSTFSYAAGLLGGWYHFSTNMVDLGSRSASAAMLYHYCTQTNQVKDGSSMVDIGFHYVATDTNGLPCDVDGDGLADYLEDSTGDGTYGYGDLSNWQSADTDGDRMPDGWEVGYGLNPLTNDANGDADNDGITNLQEYIGETNPLLFDFPLLFVAEPKVGSNVP